MSKSICHLHRAIVSIMLLAVAAGGAGTAYVLLSSRSQTGQYAGPATLTTPVAGAVVNVVERAGCAPRRRHLRDKHRHHGARAGPGMA